MRLPWRRARAERTTLGAYELRIEVVHGGTRSEGHIGRLFLDGREIHGSPGDRIDTGSGRAVVHLGTERPHLWSVSGWAVATDPPSATAAGEAT
jgi:hypothetical protein